MEENVKLTKLAKCAGCGAKVGAGVLAQLLEGIQVHKDPNLLVGFDKSDDASVYKVSDELALVQTLDFFPPIADDPYTFGQIAATNALSDIYAMGGDPKLALNIMCVPEDMPKDTVHQILRGGYEKVYEAGALITGGHSIFDDEPKYGLSVTGFVHPDRILTNSGAKEGDVLLLTKPINGIRYYYEGMNSASNFLSSTLDAWTPTHTNTSVPRAIYGDPNDNTRESTRFLENGDFVRLRQVQLGYTLPTSLVKKIYCDRIRFYVSAENVFTITGYSGANPEFSMGVLNSGIDRFTYPFSRSYTVGAQVSF